MTAHLRALPSPTGYEPVKHGTADTLARIHHFLGLVDTLPEAHELDDACRFLIGTVDNPAQILEQLGDDLDHLWSLLTDDWDDDQLDELSDGDERRCDFATYEQAASHRLSATIGRLVDGIEGVLQWERSACAQRRAAEARREHRRAVDEAVHRHPAGSARRGEQPDGAA